MQTKQALYVQAVESIEIFNSRQTELGSALLPGLTRVQGYVEYSFLQLPPGHQSVWRIIAKKQNSFWKDISHIRIPVPHFAVS